MARAKKVERPTGLSLVDRLTTIESPSLDDYVAAASEYVREATRVGKDRGKAVQVRLSKALARTALSELRAQGLPLPQAHAGERNVGGGLRVAQADVSELTETDGARLAVEIKPVHLAVGRAIWNRFGDIRSFAVNIHLKFPFAVVGGIMTIPTQERTTSGRDDTWRSTTHLVERAVERFVRAGGRVADSDAPHLLEGIAVVVFDHQTGRADPALPPPTSELRWHKFIAKVASDYRARFEID